MKVWFSIANLLAIVCLIILTQITVKNIAIYEEQLNETRLIKATEYAAEAAFLNSITISENLTTYGELGVTLLTQDTMRTFYDMMELSYDMVRCESNDLVIEDSIAVMCLAGNDGYYITDMIKDGPNTTGLKWTPKLPYSISLKRAVGTKEDTLSVSLASERWWMMSNKKLTSGWQYSENNTIWQNPEDINGETVSLTRTFADSIVSSTLTNAIAYRLSDEKFNSRPYKDGYSVYLPAINTYTGINKISSPSLIVIISHADYSQYKGLCSAMQGLKVSWKPKVIGYVNDYGEKKYCYEGQSSYAQGTNSIKMFDSVEAAAKAGYMPDIYALMQPVVRK